MAKKIISVADRSLLSITWPIFLDLLFVFLVSAVDAWFLSRISDTSAAAVGAMIPVSMLCFSLFVNLGFAGSSIASRLLGAKDDNNLGYTYGVLILMGVLLGLVLAVVMVFMAPIFSRWMGLQGDMAEMGAIYLSTIGYGAFFLALRTCVSSILSSQGKTDWNMWSTAIMTITKIFFNYAFVFGAFGFPALGIEGVAIASCIAWAASFLFSLWVVLGYFKLSVNIFMPWSTFKKSAKPILNIALPSTLEPLSWHLSQLVIISIVVNMGEIALATRVYVFNLIYIVVLFSVALSSGMQIKVAHYFGAKRYADANKMLFQGVQFGMVGAFFLVSILYFMSDQLLGVFTNKQEIWLLGASVILVAFFCEIGRVLNLLYGASLKATGDAKFIAIFGLFFMWAIAVPLAWLLGIHYSLGLIGIWIALSVDELGRGFVSLYRWNIRKWGQRDCNYAEKATN